MSDKVTHVITQSEWDENFDQVNMISYSYYYYYYYYYYY